MRRVAVLALLSGVLSACAPGYYKADQQKVTNLSNFVSDAALATVDGDCVMALTLKSGKNVRAHVARRICTEAVDGLAVAATVLAPVKAAGSAAPKP